MRGLEKLQELLTPEYLSSKKELLPVFSAMKEYFTTNETAYRTNVYMMYTESKFDSRNRYPAAGSIVACGLFAFHHSNFAAWGVTGEKIIAMEPIKQWELKKIKMLKGRKIINCYAYNMAFNYLPTLADALMQSDMKFRVDAIYTHGLSKNGMSAKEYLVFSALIPMVTAAEFKGTLNIDEVSDFSIDYRSEDVLAGACINATLCNEIADQVTYVIRQMKSKSPHTWADWRTILFYVQSAVKDTKPTPLSSKMSLKDAKGSNTDASILTTLLNVDDDSQIIITPKTFQRSSVIKERYLSDFSDEENISYKSPHLNGSKKIIATDTISQRWLASLVDKV